MLASVSLRDLVQSGQGFRAEASHDLQLGFRCQVVPILLMLSDSLLCTFIPSLPLLLRVSMWICVFTDLSVRWCQVGGCHSQGCHGYPTCLAQLDSQSQPPLLGTIPQAHLLLMSLM